MTVVYPASVPEMAPRVHLGAANGLSGKRAEWLGLVAGPFCLYPRQPPRRIRERQLDAKVSNLLALPSVMSNNLEVVTLQVLITEEQKARWIKEVYEEETS